MSSHLFTSESVSSGHPDKIADQISDLVVDKCIKDDGCARTAVETLVTAKKIVVAGEVKAPNISHKDIELSIRTLIKDIGYIEGAFNYSDIPIEIILNTQSQDISIGVDNSDIEKIGAGDQGMMFGYATNETPGYMPGPIYYAHKILHNIESSIKDGTISRDLGPDAKTQVTLIYKNNKPVAVERIVLSIQHKERFNSHEIKEILYPYIIKSFPKDWLITKDLIICNPTGRFIIGGPESDCGLTGRKIIVDSYGGSAPHGGGAFSGKDPTKVDRSAAYMTRYLAKNLVASGVVNQCLIQVAYAIGISEPISLYIKTDNASIDSKFLSLFMKSVGISLMPGLIIRDLGLNYPIYLPTSTYGHFGKDFVIADGIKLFPWEELNLQDKIQEFFFSYCKDSSLLHEGNKVECNIS